MSTDPKVNSLDELAGRVRAAREASANALALALDAGDALIEARSRISGGWQVWLKNHCHIAASTARLYVRLAERRAEIEAKAEQIGDLTLRAARRLIAKSRAPSKSKPPKTEPGKPDEKMTAVLRKALSLVKAINTSGTSAAMVESNKHEALAALQQLVVILSTKNLDPSDVALSAVKASARSYRRAA